MKNSFLLFCLFSLSAFAQSKISGFLHPSDLNGDTAWVYLSQVIRHGPQGNLVSNPVSKGQINEDLTFNIQTKLPEQQQLYFLHLKAKRPDGSYKVTSKQFLFSNRDSIFFPQGATSFAAYKNTNYADKEWQKYMAYKKGIVPFQHGNKKFLNEIRSYSKDSLQILAVKLMTVKELDEKLLLDKDIVSNKNYYKTLLADLKQSDINPLEYVFLELKLTEVLAADTRVKFTLSYYINIGLGLGLISLLIFIYSRGSKKTAQPKLSKQELLVKNLILEGNSNKEIAQELFISVSTVKSHITSIYQKLNIQSRQDLWTKYKNRPGTSP